MHRQRPYAKILFLFISSVWYTQNKGGKEQQYYIYWEHKKRKERKQTKFHSTTLFLSYLFSSCIHFSCISLSFLSCFCSHLILSSSSIQFLHVNFRGCWMGILFPFCWWRFQFVLLLEDAALWRAIRASSRCWILWSLTVKLWRSVGGRTSRVSFDDDDDDVPASCSSGCCVWLCSTG